MYSLILKIKQRLDLDKRGKSQTIKKTELLVDIEATRKTVGLNNEILPCFVFFSNLNSSL